jgi:hypothetical protein
MTANRGAVSMLQTQVAVEFGNLKRARSAMCAKHISDDVRERVRARFESQLLNLESRLDGLDGGDDGARWGELKAIGDDAAELFAELLEFIEGALARSAGIDRGVCDVVDGLLCELSHETTTPWAQLSILGEREEVHSLADIVRVRFPEFTVWAAPIAAHEFGHVVARSKAYIDAELTRLDAPWRELFCDVYGTYAVGPAFACSSVLLRFRPTGGMGDAEHPPDERRVHVVLDTLRWLDSLDNRRPYANVLKKLEGAWRAARRAAGERESLPGPDADNLEFQAAQFRAKLEANVGTARYTGWDRARDLATALVNGDGNVGRPDSVRDLLNAAWHWRIRSRQAEADALADVENRALEAARLASRRALTATKGKPE